MHVSSRSRLLLIKVQNLILEYGSMITTADEHGREDLHWLLTIAHMSDLYEISTRSPNLIDLIENASLCEDLLLD